MKSFYRYLAEASRTHKYRIRTVAKADSKFADQIKKTLFKYDVVSLSQPKKLMAQQSPLDFRNMGMVEVYVIDLEVRVPASSYVLATEIRAALGLSDAMLVVRGENEPVEIEAKAIEEIHKDDQAALLDTPDYSEAEQPKEVAYGDAYNKKLLNYLAQVKANESEEVEAIDNVKKTNRFSWLNKRDDSVAEDFNAEHDTVKPVHANSKKKNAKVEEPNLASRAGNYDHNIKRKG